MSHSIAARVRLGTRLGHTNGGSHLSVSHYARAARSGPPNCRSSTSTSRWTSTRESKRSRRSAPLLNGFQCAKDVRCQRCRQPTGGGRLANERHDAQWAPLRWSGLLRVPRPGPRISPHRVRARSSYLGFWGIRGLRPSLCSRSNQAPKRVKSARRLVVSCGVSCVRSNNERPRQTYT